MWRCTLNEQLRILKMLEDGKINADEAARLLEAIRTPSHGARRHRFINNFEHIPEIIAARINGSIKHAVARTTETFPEKERVIFTGISGDLRICGKETDTIEVTRDGFVKIVDESSTLRLKGLGGDVLINTPRKTDVTVKGVSGNIAVNDIDGQLSIKSVSGDIQVTNLSGDLGGTFVSGNVLVDCAFLKNAEITAKAANITLRMDKKTEASIEVETLDGDISCDFVLKNEEKTSHALKGILNKPTGSISIKNEHGSVHLAERI